MQVDVAIVGGGFGGSALATVLARAGRSCLVLEPTTVFADRTKGEWIAPWGVAEAERIGLADDIRRARGHVLRRHVRFGPGIDPAVALATTTPLGMLPGIDGPLTQRHPDVCQVLLDAAAEAGATVVRGIGGVTVAAGPKPSLTYLDAGGASREVTAQLVVAADGRNSPTRRALGIALHRHPPHHLFSGLLVDGADAWPEDLQMVATEGEAHVLAFPQGAGRVRLYVGFGLDRKRWLAGADGPANFLTAFGLACAPQTECLRAATPVSACATYPNEAAWVDDPAEVPGIVLLADAAGWDDPITGQGLSISLRDVRVLSDLLLASDDWTPAALAPYAVERSERMRRLRFASAMTAHLANEFGPDADRRRTEVHERALADRSVGLARFAAMVGPENLPAEAFTPSAWAQVFEDGRQPVG